MRILGIDFETTGVDVTTDRIVEVGAVLWETDTHKPLLTISRFINPGVPMPADATKVNGITTAMLNEFGVGARGVWRRLEAICTDHGVEYIVAHNGENFDKPILMAELARVPEDDVRLFNLTHLPWIDTRTDLPFDIEPISRKLNHIAADVGFVNPFQHRALFDVLTMLKVLSTFDIKEVLEYQALPWVTLQACVGYEDRQLAKDCRFSWEQAGDKKFPKMWVKRVKANMIETEKQNCKFQIKMVA